jgi:hypothetical protein
MCLYLFDILNVMFNYKYNLNMTKTNSAYLLPENDPTMTIHLRKRRLLNWWFLYFLIPTSNPLANFISYNFETYAESSHFSPPLPLLLWFKPPLFHLNFCNRLLTDFSAFLIYSTPVYSSHSNLSHSSAQNYPMTTHHTAQQSKPVVTWTPAVSEVLYPLLYASFNCSFWLCCHNPCCSSHMLSLPSLQVFALAVPTVWNVVFPLHLYGSSLFHRGLCSVR